MSSPRTAPIVAAYDGSEQAYPALTWAAREAASRRRPLCLVRVFDWQWPATSLPGPPVAYGLTVEERAVRQSVEFELEQTADRLRDTWPDVAITDKVVAGHPATALVAAAEDLDADQIVVGWTGRVSIERALVGSTATELAHDTARPLVVVHGDSTEAGFDRRGPVVVGATGSVSLSRATQFGLGFARRHQLPVLAVHAGSAPSPEVDREIETWLDIHPDLTIDLLDVTAKPEQALVECSENAALVVVGSHGRGVVRRALKGSVSHHVLHHASCTVAVVRDHALPERP